MVANLTDYNRCFSTFDPNYDLMKLDPSPIKRG